MSISYGHAPDEYTRSIRTLCSTFGFSILDAIAGAGAAGFESPTANPMIIASKITPPAPIETYNHQGHELVA